MAIGSYALGSTAICGRTATAAKIGPGQVEVSIENEVVDHLFGSIQMRDQLNGRASLNFRLYEVTPRDWDVGMEVNLKWNGYHFFGGTIESIDIEIEDGDLEGAFSMIRCVDWMRTADRFVVSANYEAKSLSEIIRDLVTNQCPILEDGIVIGIIGQTAPIDSVSFNRKTLSAALDDLCRLTGMAWKISPGKVLHCFDRATFTAPFDVGDSERRYRRISLNKNRSQYRNQEIFRGGKDLTDPITDEFRGDATDVAPEKRRRTFNTSYPIGTAPMITRLLADQVTLVPQRVGIKGIDKDGDLSDPEFKQWFYELDSNEITQNKEQDEEKNPTLSKDEVLFVEFQGLYPSAVYETNNAEVAARAAIEGGSGLYEYIDEDESIDGSEAASDRALSYLRIYGRIPRVLLYETDLPGLSVGALQTITVSALGLSSVQFMVDELTLTFPREDLPRFGISALDGERQQGWAEFWRGMARKGRKFVISENEVVEKSVRTNETFTLTDELVDSVNGSATLATYDTDPFTVWTFAPPVTVAGSGEVIGCARIGRSRWGTPYA